MASLTVRLDVQKWLDKKNGLQKSGNVLKIEIDGLPYKTLFLKEEELTPLYMCGLLKKES